MDQHLNNEIKLLHYLVQIKLMGIFYFQTEVLKRWLSVEFVLIQHLVFNDCQRFSNKENNFFVSIDCKFEMFIVEINLSGH